MGTPRSPNLQSKSLAIRLSNVITRTPVGGEGVLPLCRDAVGVFYRPSRQGHSLGVRVLPLCKGFSWCIFTAPADWVTRWGRGGSYPFAQALVDVFQALRKLSFTLILFYYKRILFAQLFLSNLFLRNKTKVISLEIIIVCIKLIDSN